jgi:hypothetical protein
MLYPGGQRSHPIGICDDRRVRPYKVPEGASAFYAPTGTGQMVYHNDDGSSLVTTNNPKYGKNQQQKERYASIRHVTKQPQQRKFQQQKSNGGTSGGGGSPGVSTLDTGSGGTSGGSSQDYKHEGESVNTEIRCTSGRIEFRIGDTVVGYYDKSNTRWSFTGEMRLGDDNADHPVYGVNGGVGKTTKTSGSGAVLVNAPLPGPPTSLDTSPLEDVLRRLDAIERRLSALEARA